MEDMYDRAPHDFCAPISLSQLHCDHCLPESGSPKAQAIAAARPVGRGIWMLKGLVECVGAGLGDQDVVLVGI